jgi:putative Mg2+ transporter-C (MgtC) family protein
VNHYGVDPDVVIRLGGAVVFGAVVGLEREVSGHGAGLRTHIAVGVGAALFGVISTLGFSEFRTFPTNTYRVDVTRVASQVVVGVGFLGGGMILRHNGGVANLTTAASIWTVAAIGLAAGVGDLGTAAVGTVLTVGYLVALLPVRRWLERAAAAGRTTLAVTLAPGAAPEQLLGRLDGHGGHLRIRIDQVEKDDGRLVVVLNIKGRPAGAVTAATGQLAALAEVTDLNAR